MKWLIVSLLLFVSGCANLHPGSLILGGVIGYGVSQHPVYVRPPYQPGYVRRCDYVPIYDRYGNIYATQYICG